MMTNTWIGIKHKNIISIHITEDYKGLIILNPEWNEVSPMLKVDVLRDLKADFDSLSLSALELYEIQFGSSDPSGGKKE